MTDTSIPSGDDTLDPPRSDSGVIVTTGSDSRPSGGSGSRERGSSSSSASIQEGQSLCVFWIGDECYALDVVYVSEAIAISSVRTVPATPREIIGMFNLRGTALAVLDLAEVLDLPGAERYRPSDRSAMTVIILSPAMIHAGLRITRVDSVVPYRLADVCRVNDGTEHPAISGVLTMEERGGQGVTILNGTHLLEKLKATRDTLRRPRQGPAHTSINGNMD